MTPFNAMLFKIIYLVVLPISYCTELCTFNEGTCEWDIRPPWNVVSLAILPRHQHPGLLNISKTPDVITSEGPFLLAQGKFASVPSSRVTSQKISKSDHMRILAYRYQRRGMATLRILLKNQTDEILLDTISSNEIERIKWHRRSVIFPPIPDYNQTSVIFECDNIQTAEDIIAVDEIDVATPANVMWAGQDSKFFDEEDIRRREIRRSSKLSNVCTPISCHFRSSICSWQSTNIGSMNEKVIWTEKEDSSIPDSTGTQNGWNRVLISLESVPKGIPVILILKSITGANDFVAFSSIDLVDGESKTLTCDQVTSPVQPQSNQLVRLTALQNLKMLPIESILYQPPISTTSPISLFPIPPTPSISFNSDEKPSSLASPVGILPISPTLVSARGIPIFPITSFSNPLIPLSNARLPFHF